MNDGQAPSLSVVIAAVNEPGLLRNCLRALERQGPEIEIVVVTRFPGAAEAVAAEFPRARVLSGAGLTIPQMRAKGFRQARAPLLAVLEDHTDPVPGWSEALRRGHEAGAAVVGGSVTNGSFSAVDWAAFLIEYHEHMTPIPEGPARSLPGNNCSYRREALEACGDVLDRGLWETFLHEALARRGFGFRCENGAEVVHAKHFSLRHFAEQRWHLARSYAGMRANGYSIGRRLFYAAATPLLPAILTLRIARGVAARPGRGYAGIFLRMLPLIVLFLVIGSLAELVGCLAGEGNSTEKVV